MIDLIGVLRKIKNYIGGTTPIPDAAKREAGRMQTKTKTIDLQQAAGSYDLFEGTSQNVEVDMVSIRLPNIDCSDDAPFTGISIQDDDVTPNSYISQITGAKANLTAESHLSSDSPNMLKVGSKLRLTIYGGASDDATVCEVECYYRASVDGGYLA